MSGHVVESTSELSVFMKAGAMAGSEKDAGFCSGGDEDDMSGLHSPSASEDSVEVQVTPISLRNKRKLAEPRKIQELSTAPLKKRRFELIEEPVVIDEESRPVRSPSPFRPWSSSAKGAESKTPASSTTPLATSSGRIGSLPSADASGTISPSSPESQEDLAILKDREEEEDCETVARKREEERLRGVEGLPVKLEDSNLARNESCIEDRLQACLPQRREPRQKLEPRTSTTTTTSSPPIPLVPLTHPRLQEEPLSLVLRGEVPRVPSHPAVSGAYDRSSSYSMEGPSHHHSQNQPSSNGHHHHHHHGGSGGHSRQQQHQQREGGQQRNYKNMTRERRIEANARERTRVHTISAAFDTLRRAIPAYSHNQKLSKLSVLRIACSYIMTLGKIVNTPEGESANGASLGACVDLVSRTIQTEGKLRKRKED